MKITVSKNAGFCPGVKRADIAVRSLISKRKNGEKIYTLGSLIHNSIYNDELASLGVRSVSLEDVEKILLEEPKSNHTFVVRTHGITKEQNDALLAFKEKYNNLKKHHQRLLKQYDFEYDITEYERRWFEAIEKLREFQFIESEHLINKYLNEDVAVLAEGAQGSMLDIDFGTYPYVTSSNTVCAGACTGLGVAPGRIGEVFGIFKAYCTRVGSGPFPTELHDETGELLAEIGREFGSTTGRKRRCGWLDLVALKYAVMINGVTKLIMMKTDVLNTMETIKAAIAYKIKGVETTEFPYEHEAEIEPVYKEFKGWNCDICNIQNYDDFPAELKEYIEFIEKETGIPIWIVSVGADRKATIFRQ